MWILTVQVHNIVEASFKFRDGKITHHNDVFDLWRWEGQALGMKGKLLGWVPAMKSSVRAKARASLDKYMSDNAPAATAPATVPANTITQ